MARALATDRAPPHGLQFSAKDLKVSPPYSVVTRDDGAQQLAYKGKPLYLFASDKKAGDRTGDNFKDIWHVVKD